MKVEITNRVLDYIYDNKLLVSGDKVVVGVSGGPDSICLLEVLYMLRERIGISIAAAHINHMLRGDEANKDEEYVREFCERRDIQFFSKRIDIAKFAKDEKMSTETAGREARYEFFNEVMDKLSFNKIATAHNANDQVETILMRMMRGTGLDGLTGIPVKRDDRYIRPILFLQREEIEKFCEDNKLMPRIDKSNLEREYSRNKIRLDIIPYMKENFNSDIIMAINRMANILQEDNELVNQVIKEYFERYCINKDGYIIIKKELFDTKSVAINRVIKLSASIVSGSMYDLELKHINYIKQLASLGTSRRIDLPNGMYAENIYGDIYIRRKVEFTKDNQDEMIIEKSLDKNEIQFKKYNMKFEVIDNKKNIKFDDNRLIKYFNYDKINGNIIIRSRKDGDRIIPLGMNGSKKLKDIFIDSKIPAGDRDSIPIIQFGDDIAWVVGLKVSNKYRVTKETIKLLKITVMERN